MIDVWIPLELPKHFNAELLFTDTGNLTYEIKLFKHKHLFNFSNYPDDSKFFDQANKNVTSEMKDESEGKIIDEFVRLKSKMYSIKILRIKNLIGKRS